MSEEEYYEEEVIDDDDDEIPTDLQDIRVALKPRCNLRATIKEFSTNEKIGSVELDIYKHWLRDADDDEVYSLFDALGRTPSLRKLSIISKGSSPQTLPVSLLSHCVGEASLLQELRLMHMRWKGDDDDFEVLAATVGEHTRLRVIQLHVESMDTMESTLAAAGQVPTLQQVEVHTANAATDKIGLSTALQSLCTSKSLQSLKLSHVTHKFEILSSMARLLSANTTLQELFIEAHELDLNGGMAMASMLTANAGLTSFVLKLDKMHGPKLPDAFIQALDMNTSLAFFQIILDGRMSDMKVVRAMQLQFRDFLRQKYKVSSQVGLSMGVTCERKTEE